MQTRSWSGQASSSLRKNLGDRGGFPFSGLPSTAKRTRAIFCVRPNPKSGKAPQPPTKPTPAIYLQLRDEGEALQARQFKRRRPRVRLPAPRKRPLFGAGRHRPPGLRTPLFAADLDSARAANVTDLCGHARFPTAFEAAHISERPTKRRKKACSTLLFTQVPLLPIRCRRRFPASAFRASSPSPAAFCGFPDFSPAMCPGVPSCALPPRSA